MPQSDSEALRAFIDALHAFIAYSKKASELKSEDYADAENLERFLKTRDELIGVIANTRRPALVAGVRVGKTFEKMSDMVNHCQTSCIKHKVLGKSNNHLRLFAKLVKYLRSLSDLVAVAESIETGKSSSHSEPARAQLVLSKTEAAVLSIIKAQPSGQGIQGKEILKELRKKNIHIAESSLRRHILPKLKTCGVTNHPAAGGYLPPKA